MFKCRISGNHDSHKRIAYFTFESILSILDQIISVQVACYSYFNLYIQGVASHRSQTNWCEITWLLLSGRLMSICVRGSVSSLFGVTSNDAQGSVLGQTASVLNLF